MALWGAARYDTFRYDGFIVSYDTVVSVPDWASPFRIEIWEYDGTRVRVIPEILGGRWKRTVNAPASLDFQVQIGGPGVDEIQVGRKIMLFDASGKPCGAYKITAREWVHENGFATLRVNALDYLAQLQKEVIEDYSATGATTTEILSALLAEQLQGDPLTLGHVDNLYDALTVDVNFVRQNIYDCLRDLRTIIGGKFYIGGDDANELYWTKSDILYTYRRNSYNGRWYWDTVPARTKQLRYGRNIESIARHLDYSALVTRLYAYGAGDDEYSRITLTDAGEANEYIDSANAATYGIITDVWVDKRYDVAANLLAAARARLDELDDPRETWEIGIVDLYHINPGVYPHEELEIGQTVRVIDDDMTIDGVAVNEEAVIQSIDVDLLTPANSSIVAGLRRMTIADTVGNLKREVYRYGTQDVSAVALWATYE